MSALLPQADAAIIAQALRILFTPDDVIEVRALSLRGRNRTDAGYFDAEHRSDLVSAAVRMNGKASAVYVNLNPIDPQLLARYANRIQEGASSTATDANVTRRRWLLLDFDPVRPKDTSATDLQVEAAHAIARECYEHLRGEGWPEPVCAHSGNGYHLDYPLDLPNNEASRDLIKAVLKALATRFDSDAIKVDQSVFNAGRIVKLYGTVANKGDHTELAPWRLSRILKAPERNAVVTVEQLTALVPVQPQGSNRTTGASSFDLAGFLSRLGIGYREDLHEGRERYKLEHCPFNSEHGFGEAAIFRDSAGVLGFRCLHNTCTDKRWTDVRSLIDGTKESRTGRTAGLDGTGRYEAGAHDVGGWPEPLPLIVSHERLPYPADALPGLLGEAVREVQAFVQCPVALAACSALSVLSVAAQGLVDVQRRDGLSAPVSLFLLVLAESGERKTTCDKIFSAVLDEWDAAQRESYRLRIAEHAAKMRAWAAIRDGIKGAIHDAARKNKPTDKLSRDLADHEANQPVPLFVPSVKHGDITPEELARTLATGWHSGAIVSSEAGVVDGVGNAPDFGV